VSDLSSFDGERSFTEVFHAWRQQITDKPERWRHGGLNVEAVMAPIYISQRWDRFIRNTKLPRIRFHDLRHTHDPHAGKWCPSQHRQLGRSKVGITPDLYSRVIPGMQEDPAAMLDAALKAATQKLKQIVAIPSREGSVEQIRNEGTAVNSAG